MSTDTKQLVTLTFLEGPFRDVCLHFQDSTELIFGRGPDCHIRFPDTEENREISRRHFRLQIRPPAVSIADLISLNGTWINGKQMTISSRQSAPLAVSLKDRDRIRLGTSLLEVGIGSPESAGGPAAGKDGRRACQRCGLPLADQDPVPAARFLCANCRSVPAHVTEALLGLADHGLRALEPLKGYRMERPLGRGSLGAVYLLQHAETHEKIAIKILLPELYVNDWAQRMFLREIRNAQILDHANVVRLLAAGIFHGVLYFTMEYCTDGSLEDLLYERDGTLPWAEAVAIIVQALDGLEYIHGVELGDIALADGSHRMARGLVHRDLKPANILLAREDGRRVAKIADIGVSKAYDTAGLSGQTRTGTISGSPVFMPRQQVMNYKYARPDVDVWAMAATLYTLITGRFPRDFPPNEDGCVVVLQTRPVPILNRGVPIPADLAAVIDAALEDDPEIRFKTAKSLQESLITAVAAETEAEAPA